MMRIIGAKTWEIRLRGPVPPEAQPDMYLAEVARLVSVSATLLAVGDVQIQVRLLEAVPRPDAMGPLADA
ncbi:MAG: hypothetical protein K6T59_11570 [Bryobacteraceae bacterium]|nr:hypothetical protein [Bryobacteraceae bacterium]